MSDESFKLELNDEGDVLFIEPYEFDPEEVLWEPEVFEEFAPDLIEATRAKFPQVVPQLVEALQLFREHKYGALDSTAGDYSLVVSLNAAARLAKEIHSFGLDETGWWPVDDDDFVSMKSLREDWQEKFEHFVEWKQVPEGEVRDSARRFWTEAGEAALALSPAAALAAFERMDELLRSHGVKPDHDPKSPQFADDQAMPKDKEHRAWFGPGVVGPGGNDAIELELLAGRRFNCVPKNYEVLAVPPREVEIVAICEPDPSIVRVRFVDTGETRDLDYTQLRPLAA